MVGRFGWGTGNPVLEGWHSQRRGEVERGGEGGGGGGETDSRKFSVASGGEKRGDKTGPETGAVGRNKERRKVVVILVYGLR